MEYVLTSSSQVNCGHDPGKVTVQSGAKLTVGKAPVLTAASIDMMPVTGCATVAAGPPPTITCAAVSATPLPAPPLLPGVQKGASTKLTVNKMPVILETLAGATNGSISGTPQVLLAAKAMQAKLRAD